MVSEVPEFRFTRLRRGLTAVVLTKAGVRGQKTEDRKQRSACLDEISQPTDGDGKSDEYPTSELRSLTTDNYFFSEVFNIAFGGNTTLNQLLSALRDNLAKFDEKIKEIEPEYGPFRVGDIPHSKVSILKAETILDYRPEYNVEKGLNIAAGWYYEKLR